MTPLRVLAAELLKLRRAPITWISLLAYSLGPAMGGLFLWIAREPGRAAELGLLGTKAELAGLDPTWAGYAALLTQTVGIGGMLLGAVVTAWVFGREFAEGTAKEMLALPVARAWWVAAKLVVVLLWMAAATALMLGEAGLIGALLGLPGWTAGVALRGAAEVALASGVAWLLTPPVAWLATLGRGYLPPLGFAIGMLVLGNVLGATGWGRWFPWSVVPLFAGVAGPRAETLAPGSLAVVVGVAALGAALTAARLVYADHTR